MADRLSIGSAEPGADSEFTCLLDPTKKPKTIDMKVTKGPDRGKTNSGIYLLDGDNLKTCFAYAKKGRPSEFATKANSDLALIVLKRARP